MTEDAESFFHDRVACFLPYKSRIFPDVRPGRYRSLYQARDAHPSHPNI